MSPSPADFTLICPHNDLESQTIVELAEALGIQTLVHPGGWGTRLDAAFVAAHRKDFKPHLVVVELPNPGLEQALRDAGHRLTPIDHHDYPGLARHRPDSSLEQFAALVGHPLTEEQWQVAVNDRDFLFGLCEAGVSWLDALEIRRRDRRAQRLANGQDAGDFEATLAYVAEHRLALDDLDILVVQEAAPPHLLEAMQWPSQKDYREAAARGRAYASKPCLILLHAAEKESRIVELQFCGPARFDAALRELLDAPELAGDLDMWLGGGRHSRFFGARPGQPAAQRRMDELVGRILDLALVTGRPLAGYDCTFLLPLDLYLDAELGARPGPAPRVGQSGLGYRIEEFRVPEPGQVLQRHIDDRLSNAHFFACDDNLRADDYCEKVRYAQAYEYFFTGLRDHLFTLESGDRHGAAAIEPLRHFRISPADLAGKVLVLLGDEDGGRPTVRAALRDVSLYRYYNGLVVLGIRVALGNGANTSWPLTGADWWRALVFPDPDKPDDAALAGRQVGHLLRYTKLVRQLFASFAEQLKEEKIGPVLLCDEGDREQAGFRVRDPVNGVVTHFLQAFFGAPYEQDWKRDRRLHQLVDDRMFVNVAYAPAGEPPPPSGRGQAEMERLFSLALYVDEASDTYAAADRHAYDAGFIEKLKAEHRLTRWDQVGTRLGASPYSLAAMGQGRFFNNVVLGAHFPYLYARILILLLLYRSTLLQFDRRISIATRELTHDQDRGGFRNMRRDFIQFTNIYWLRELTPQIQGRELTDRLVAVLRLEAKYKLIKDEMERADEFIASRRDGHFGLVALWLAALAILLTFDKEAWPLGDGLFWQGLQWVALLGLAGSVWLAGDPGLWRKWKARWKKALEFLLS